MLSLGLISTSLTSGPELPSTLILKGDDFPPESFTCVKRSFCSLLLKILKDWVTEPELVKTVSKNKVSALVFKDAPGLVMKESFLHEKKMVAARKMENKSFKLFGLLND